MKKLVKCALITAVVLIVIGTGLFIGGSVAFGGVRAVQSALTGFEFYLDHDGVHLSIENHPTDMKRSHHLEEHQYF